MTDESPSPDLVRPLRLFALACVRRFPCFPKRLPVEAWKAIEVAESHANGLATDRDLANVLRLLHPLCRRDSRVKAIYDACRTHPPSIMPIVVKDVSNQVAFSVAWLKVPTSPPTYTASFLFGQSVERDYTKHPLRIKWKAARQAELEVHRELFEQFVANPEIASEVFDSPWTG